MESIWHLDNITHPVLLYKSDETSFIVTRNGDWAAILSCGLFTIINQELLSFLQLHLSEMPMTHLVSIYDYELKKHFEGYHRIYIPDSIEPETINTLDGSGKKIWCHSDSGSIFISSELKTTLEQSNIKGLVTYGGFCMFGGLNK